MTATFTFSRVGEASAPSPCTATLYPSRPGEDALRLHLSGADFSFAIVTLGVAVARGLLDDLSLLLKEHAIADLADDLSHRGLRAARVHPVAPARIAARPAALLPSASRSSTSATDLAAATGSALPALAPSGAPPGIAAASSSGNHPTYGSEEN
jgi:hypothetical protein